MWHWDQGHLDYFQFDALRRIAAFVLEADIRAADRNTLANATGLSFAVPDSHTPWRNYSRTLKLALLVSEQNGVATPTAVAQALAHPGAVTCDEYFHFLVRTFTEPAPALREWRQDSEIRYPLLVALKYLMTKAAATDFPSATLDELIGAYRSTTLSGTEDEWQFIEAVQNSEGFANLGREAPENLYRQARESLLVMSQISYLHVSGQLISVSIAAADAAELFKDLAPVGGPRAPDRESEIRRLANCFADGSTEISFDFPNTVIGDIEDSGFSEGGKVKRTHIVIERSAGLRRAFFDSNATSVCDLCTADTSRRFPWAERILDLHHLLPLASGTRVRAEGTTLEDLVPICPTCHRAVHRFYDTWLSERGRRDFENGPEARSVYEEAKQSAVID